MKPLTSAVRVRGASLGEYALLLFAVLIVGALGFKALGNPVKQNADDARAWLEGDGPQRGGSGGGSGGGGVGARGDGSSPTRGGGAGGSSPTDPFGSADGNGQTSASNGSSSRLSDAPGTTGVGGVGVGGTSGGESEGASSASSGSTTTSTTAATNGGTDSDDRTANGAANKTIGATDDEVENPTVGQRVKEAIIDLSPLGDIRDAVNVAKDIYANGINSENLGQAVMVGFSITGPGKVVKIASRASKAIKKADKAKDAAEKAKVPEKLGEKAGETPAVKKGSGDVAKEETKKDRTEQVADAIEDAKGKADKAQQIKDGYEELKNAAAKRAGGQVGAQTEGESTAANEPKLLEHSPEFDRGTITRVRDYGKDEVVKEIDPLDSRGRSIPLNQADKERLAQEIVRDTNRVREKLPEIVPKTEEAGPTFIRQTKVGGLKDTELTGYDAKVRAEREMSEAIATAERTMSKDGRYTSRPQTAEQIFRTPQAGDKWQYEVDHNPENFRFDKDGHVTAWYDPIWIGPSPSR